MVEMLSDAAFKQKTAKGNAIVDFYADWCGPCQVLKPIFEKLSTSEKKAHFFKVNVDDNSDTAEAFGVRSIPTVVFLKDGKEVDRFMGVVHEEEMKKKLSKNFG